MYEIKKIANLILISSLILSVLIYISRKADANKYLIKTINKEIVNTNQYKIDVNTASDKDFDNLPGIGPKLAQEIVSHRNRNGSFESIEAINDIKGIGKSKFMQIKDYLSIKHL